MSDVCPTVKDRVIAIEGKDLRGSGRSARGLQELHQDRPTRRDAVATHLRSKIERDYGQLRT